MEDVRQDRRRRGLPETEAREQALLVKVTGDGVETTCLVTRPPDKTDLVVFSWHGHGRDKEGPFYRRIFCRGAGAVTGVPKESANTFE